MIATGGASTGRPVASVVRLPSLSRFFLESFHTRAGSSTSANSVGREGWLYEALLGLAMARQLSGGWHPHVSSTPVIL